MIADALVVALYEAGVTGEQAIAARMGFARRLKALAGPPQDAKPQQQAAGAGAAAWEALDYLLRRDYRRRQRDSGLS
jgi:hypothetical protein